MQTHWTRPPFSPGCSRIFQILFASRPASSRFCNARKRVASTSWQDPPAHEPPLGGRCASQPSKPIDAHVQKRFKRAFEAFVAARASEEREESARRPVHATRLTSL
eukprot:scaffold17_cov354-Pavlova_lutheri.AAC.64